MQIGISTYTYTWAIGVPGSEPESPMSVFSLINRASELGVQCVQLADNLPLTGLSLEELSKISAFATNLGIGIEMGARGLTEENLHHHINLAAGFHSPILRMVIDDGEYQPDIDTIVAVIRNAADSLARNNINLAIENHDRLPASVFRQIVEKCGTDNTGICLDCVNSMGIGEGMATVLDTLAPFTLNLHVKDFTVRRMPHKMGFLIEGAPAGKGFLDLPRVIEKLNSYGKCRSAILELWTPPAGSLGQTISREDDWAFQSIRYMKSVL